MIWPSPSTPVSGTSEHRVVVDAVLQLERLLGRTLRLPIAQVVQIAHADHAIDHAQSQPEFELTRLGVVVLGISKQDPQHVDPRRPRSKAHNRAGLDMCFAAEGE